MIDVSSSRGLILYDFLLCRGGAEQVTLTLAGGIHNAEACVGFRNPEAFIQQELTTQCYELGALPRVDFRAWRTISGIYAFRHRAAFIERYDWAVFSGSNAPVAVHYRPKGRNIYYCHTIPRFAYDLYNWHQERLPAWQRPVFAALAKYVRESYEKSIVKMDRVLANSANVQNRLRKYLNIESDVVYPPCDTEGYRWLGDGEYYLSTARLEPYKRVDLIVAAFLKMPNRRLIVASGGSEERRLRDLAKDCNNIKFVGWQSAHSLRQLVGNALATVYVAKDEDFGMSPVESMAAGKPVIGVNEGGIAETVLNGQTGILLSAEPSVGELVDAIENFSPSDARDMQQTCKRRANRFTVERFLTRMQNEIDSINHS